jgi:hypothetical protein
MMQPGSPAQAAAVLEQPRIVGGDALEERLDRALDLGGTRARVTGTTAFAATGVRRGPARPRNDRRCPVPSGS